MEFVVGILSIVIYLIVGFVVGFVTTSHHYVLAGYRPKTSNKLILFLARPTRDITGFQKLIYALAMIIWVPIFFTLIALPIILSGKYASEMTTYILIGLIPIGFVGKLIGAKKWESLV